jgi:polyisoprenyl-teichoic acid--peptidoglycan teichoic acid transferase
MMQYRKHTTSNDGRSRSQRAFRRPPQSIDGFVGPAIQRSSRQKIGSFRREEGFHARPQPDIAKKFERVDEHKAAVGVDDEVIHLDLPPDVSKQKRSKGIKSWFRFRGLTRRQKIKKASIFLVILMIIFGGLVLGRAYWLARQVLQGGGSAAALEEGVDPSRLRVEGDGRVNIMLIGKDEAAGLTDSILLASIDPIHYEAGLVSIPRDLYVQSEDLGWTKINEVYPRTRSYEIAQGASASQAEKKAIRALEDTVAETLGMPVHYYAAINFEGFQKAVDTVGGIEINVEDPVYEIMFIDGRRYELNVPAGRQQFDGFRALAYSRSRMTSPRGDFDRNRRQREVIVALKDKILSAQTLANPVRINQLLGDFGDSVETNLSANELLKIYEIGSKIPSSSIKSIGLADPPNELVVTSNIGGLSVVIPSAGQGDFSEIQSYLRNTLRDAFLRKENAKVLVLNGTMTEGLATQTTEHLKSFGYRLMEPADAPTKNIQTTVLVDLRGGENKYTKHYLERRFGVSMTSRLPDATIDPGDADFVIIVGQNEINRLQN